MSEPREGRHVTRQVDGHTFDVWPLIWPDRRKSWEINHVKTDTLLTMDESMDECPSDDDLRDLLAERRICKTCNEAVFDTDHTLREHLASHHTGAWSFDTEQVRECYLDYVETGMHDHDCGITSVPSADPSYPGIVVKIHDRELVLVEHMPDGKYAIRVWAPGTENPLYSSEFEHAEEKVDA